MATTLPPTDASLPPPVLMPYTCDCNDGPHPAADFHHLDGDGTRYCTWCKAVAVAVDAQGRPIGNPDAVPEELDTLTIARPAELDTLRI